MSTIIVNHVSWLDVFIMISQFKCGLAPDAGFAKTPVAGTALLAYDAIFMPRAKSENDKHKALDMIRER